MPFFPLDSYNIPINQVLPLRLYQFALYLYLVTRECHSIETMTVRSFVRFRILCNFPIHSCMIGIIHENKKIGDSLYLSLGVQRRNCIDLIHLCYQASWGKHQGIQQSVATPKQTRLGSCTLEPLNKTAHQPVSPHLEKKPGNLESLYLFLY